MKAEIISIGTEMLLGQLVDTNSVWLSQQLTLLGINSHFKTTVGDNRQNICSVLEIANSRADIIITTGGLGPTQDDITKESLAEVLGLKLVQDQELVEIIESKFQSRNMIMSQNNLRQSYYPKGSIVLDHFPGTAPGLYLKHKNKHYFLMPGVPYEMKSIFENSVVPILNELQPDGAQIFTEIIKLWGIPESNIAEILSDIDEELAQLGNPKLSYLASGINGISVRISARAQTHIKALALIDPYKKEIVSRLEPYVFAYNEGTMEKTILQLCREKNITFGCIEWFTAGMMSSRLAAYGNDLSMFMGGTIEKIGYSRDLLRTRQKEWNADAVLSVIELPQDNDKIWQCELHILLKDQYYSKLLQVARHQREEAMAFAVINSFSFFKDQLLSAEK